jgi:hypothetical protein
MLDYSTPTTDLAELRAAKRQLAEAVWRAEVATAEMVRAANRVRLLMGWPAMDAYQPYPEAVAQDAALARAGWTRANAALGEPDARPWPPDPSSAVMP